MDILLTRTRFKFGFNPKKPGSWKDRAVNAAEWETWDRDQRKAQGWRSGLGFWTKTNCEGSRVLLARHWPHRLCWSWSIWVGLHRKKYDGPRRLEFVFHRGYRFLNVSLFGPYIRVSWQDSDHMIGLGYRDSGPKIIWAHHLQHAEPVGSA